MEEVSLCSPVATACVMAAYLKLTSFLQLVLTSVEVHVSYLIEVAQTSLETNVTRLKASIGMDDINKVGIIFVQAVKV